MKPLILKSVFAIPFLILSYSGNVDGSANQNTCKYYGYFVFGNTMLDGKLDNNEMVYRGLNIVKSQNDFEAAFNLYRSKRPGEFGVINIGPYNTEAVICQEIKKARQHLVNQDYKEDKRSKHTLPAIILYGNELCE